ncbi:metal ABC transporter permease ['Camptotheca acuminata' phytoplasma]|uniref:metal ABC transporter permease n=1 Tax='Camptotheca acuminata' phytoplasma TaxID=3239192 RepID=UPI00351A86F9
MNFIEKISQGFELDVFFVVVLTSLCLSALGIFLILKKLSMVIDAISHSVLLGIVLGFLVVKKLDDPLLMIGAVLIGLLTFYCIQFLQKHKQINKDSAIGIVFTTFFAIAIILISTFTRDVHIDNDAVFTGNIELVTFDKLKRILPILIINILFVLVFYKELKIFIFDPALATILGFSITLINYLLMSLVSITAVVSFDVVGSVMTIACFIGPATTALLLTKNLFHGFLLSLWFSFISSSCGYYLAIIFDAPISGMIAIVILVIFLLVLYFNPVNGILVKIIVNYSKKQKFDLLEKPIYFIEEIAKDLKWPTKYSQKICNKIIENGYVEKNKKNNFVLTELGKQIVDENF